MTIKTFSGKDVSKLIRSAELGRGVLLLRYPPSVAMMSWCLSNTVGIIMVYFQMQEIIPDTGNAECWR